MSAASILAQGQALLAREFPATIHLRGHDYPAATNGLRRELTLAEGPSQIARRVTFWLPVASFTAVNQAIPRELSALRWQGVEYQIEVVILDPTGTNVTLNCIQHPQ